MLTPYHLNQLKLFTEAERLAERAAIVAQSQAACGWVNPRYRVMCPRPLAEQARLPYYVGAVLQGYNHITLIIPTLSQQGVYHVRFA